MLGSLTVAEAAMHRLMLVHHSVRARQCQVTQSALAEHIQLIVRL